MRIDQFIDSMNNDELDAALDKLLLDRYGSKSQKLGRLRLLINNEITKKYYGKDADTDERIATQIKINREIALNNWTAQYETAKLTNLNTNSGPYAKDARSYVTLRRQKVKQNISTLNQGNCNDQSLADELTTANNMQTNGTGEVTTANNSQTNETQRAIKMIEVDIGAVQKVKIPEKVVHYYAAIPSEDEEQYIINEVLHDQTVGLMHEPRRITKEISRDTLTHTNVQPHNQQIIPQFRIPHERDLSNIIYAWKLTFSGNAKENIEEYLSRVKEHRKIVSLTDAELMRAVPMLLQLPALNYYRTNENKWKSWSEVETAF